MTNIAKNREDEERIDQFKNDIRFRRKIEHVETIPSKEANYKKVDNLEKKLLKYLEDRNISL